MSECSKQAGLIPLCPHAGCAYRCCDFQQGNYIATYPGELERAQAGGASIKHLKVLSKDEHGGERVKCTARDTETCDGGYKPLDCASYPFFPASLDDKGRVTALIKGKKCPLVAADVRSHMEWVTEEWERLVRAQPVVGDWLEGVTMVDYGNVQIAEIALVLGYDSYGATAELIQAARARGLVPILVGNASVNRQRKILNSPLCIASNDAVHDPRALAEELRLELLPRLFRDRHFRVSIVLNCQDWMWPLYIELTRVFPESASVAPTLIELTTLKPNLRYLLRDTDFHVPYAVVPISQAELTLPTLDFGSRSLIVKPVTGAASSGVSKIDPHDARSVRHAIDEIRKANARFGPSGLTRVHLLDRGVVEVNPADYLLVEKFVEGDEYSIEGYVDKMGQIETMVLSRKTDSREHPFRDLEYVHNPRDPRRGAIEGATRQLMERIGFRGQVFHLEVKVGADGTWCKPIELNPRQGGGSIRAFVRGITGIDLLQKSLHELLAGVGQTPVTVLRVVQPDGISPGSYTLKGCRGLTTLNRDDKCVYAQRFVPNGAHVNVGAQEYYLLEMGVTASTETEAIGRARELAARVKPTLKPAV